jgi:hypothetical protein
LAPCRLLVSCQQRQHAKHGWSWREARVTSVGCMHTVIIWGMLYYVCKCIPGVLPHRMPETRPKTVFALQPLATAIYNWDMISIHSRSKRVAYSSCVVGQASSINGYTLMGTSLYLEATSSALCLRVKNQPCHPVPKPLQGFLCQLSLAAAAWSVIYSTCPAASLTSHRLPGRFSKTTGPWANPACAGACGHLPPPARVHVKDSTIRLSSMQKPYQSADAASAASQSWSRSCSVRRPNNVRSTQ